MATTRGEPEEAPTPVERAEGIVRSIVAGHEQGAIRRILLYGVALGFVIGPFPLLAVIPLALLLATDGGL